MLIYSNHFVLFLFLVLRIRGVPIQATVGWQKVPSKVVKKFYYSSNVPASAAFAVFARRVETSEALIG